MLISNTKVNYLITWEPFQAYRAKKKTIYLNLWFVKRSIQPLFEKLRNHCWTVLHGLHFCKAWLAQNVLLYSQ